MKIMKIFVSSESQNTPTIRRIGSSSFSNQFGEAEKREKERQLKKLLDDIKKKGKQILDTQSISSVHDYKIKIKEYLSLVLQDAYRIKRIQDIYSGNLSTIVETIDKELDRLAAAVLSEERDNLSIIDSLESIEGLLVDVYE